MDSTREHIIEIAAQRALEVWTARQQPYLLALLGPDLKARGVDYKEVLRPLRLKEFLQSEGPAKVKLVLHPTQRAKIGIIPKDQDFSYDASVVVPTVTSELDRSTQGAVRPPTPRFVVMNFLQLVATLPKEEAEKVQIPTSVLAMLVKAR